MAALLSNGEATTGSENNTQANKRINYKAGDKDKHGETVKLVYSITKNYIVYEVEGPIEQSCVCLIGSTPDCEQFALNLSTVRPKLSELKAVLYKCDNDEAIKIRRGHITTLALQNPDEAIKQFDDLINDINSTYREKFQNKILYLGGAFIMLMLFCTAASAIRIAAIQKWIDPKFETLELIFYVLTSGVIGGFISASYKLKSVVFEKGISPWYFLAYGIERLVLSILASIALFFAVKANIVFGFIKDAPNPFYGYIILGILAGFSETLIPSLLTKIEKQGLDDKDNK